MANAGMKGENQVSSYPDVWLPMNNILRWNVSLSPGVCHYIKTMFENEGVKAN